MQLGRVTVVMCAYNEADGIKEFLLELAENLREFDPRFIVVDDCSTDSTIEVLNQMISQGSLNLDVIVNQKNQGHGPSTMRALNAGVSSSRSIVVSMDGDGQILGLDVRLMIEYFMRTDLQVVEGVRTGRKEPPFRRLVSWATRMLVWIRSRSFPSDANTPFRVYRREFLEDLLRNGHIGSTIPNLYISTICRIKDVSMREFPIRSISRRGSTEHGTTWNQRFGFLPSKRFIRFCFAAIREWLLIGNGKIGRFHRKSEPPTLT